MRGASRWCRRGGPETPRASLATSAGWPTRSAGWYRWGWLGRAYSVGISKLISDGSPSLPFRNREIAKRSPNWTKKELPFKPSAASSKGYCNYPNRPPKPPCSERRLDDSISPRQPAPLRAISADVEIQKISRALQPNIFPARPTKMSAVARTLRSGASARLCKPIVRPSHTRQSFSIDARSAEVSAVSPTEARKLRSSPFDRNSIH